MNNQQNNNRSQAAPKTAQSRAHESRVDAGKKAADRRGHESLSEADKKGGQVSNSSRNNQNE